MQKRYFGQGTQLVTGPSVGNYFYTRDHLGSLREMVDASGVTRTRYDYDSYGRRTKLGGDLDSDWGFTGHFFHSPTGLHLAHYRSYDSGLGRWLSRDPLGERAGVNPYVYVENNPLSWTDPLGLDNGGSSPTASSMSPVFYPNPTFDPGFWNDPSRLELNNCYNYALDLPTGGFKQPGGKFWPWQHITCSALSERVKGEGAISTNPGGGCPSGTHEIRLWANGKTRWSGEGDFHFYRLDANGCWSDKPGSTPARQRPDPTQYEGYENCGDMCVRNQSY